MRNSTKLAVTLALVLAVMMVVAGGINYNSPADAAAVPFGAKSGNETPVRATKGDRLDVRPEIRPEIRQIAGVTVVLRDISRIVR